MEALVDNDAIIKLARFSLMSEFDRVLRSKGYKPPPRCVPVAESSLRLRQKALWDKYPTESVRDDVRAFIKSCKPLEDIPCDAKRVALLASIPNVDSGELVFFDYACANKDAVIITGDKRCIVALAASKEGAEIVKTLQGRIVHLESVFEAMNALVGWKNVRAKLCSDASADPRLYNAVDSKHHEKTALQNLSDRVQSLLGDSAGLLASWG